MTQEEYKDFMMLFEEEKALLLTKIEKLIIEEILIAQREGDRTSRLTSLLSKIKELK